MSTDLILMCGERHGGGIMLTRDLRMRGKSGSEWADAHPTDWLVYGHGASEEVDPIDQGDAPSIWHAMAAADKALLAAGHKLADPAPEPPDLSGVTFGAWDGVGRRECPRGGVVLDRAGLSINIARKLSGLLGVGPLTFSTITTREAADAFLRACGATLEEA